MIILFLSMLVIPATMHAQEENFEVEYFSGRVIDVTTDEEGYTLYQTKLSNEEIISIDSYGESLSVGNNIYVEKFTDPDTYNFVTINRTLPIVLLLVFFIVSILLLARKKGIRSLGSLALSMALLFLVMVPLLLKGFDPIWTTLLFGLVVLTLSIFMTHGFNRQSLVSFLGSFSSIVIAIILLGAITKISSLTGLINEEIQFLSFEVDNAINLVRLVSASIIIGILGVLDDITVTQVAVVRELSSNEKLSPKDIFVKALRVGRDHISSLVNTLVFAYVGATLPMIMFITLLEVPFGILISQEFIFVEIIRSLIGAIALTVAVPVTTWLASFVFLKAIHRDSCALESACAHGHHH